MFIDSAGLAVYFDKACSGDVPSSSFQWTISNHTGRRSYVIFRGEWAVYSCRKSDDM
jgi:hypothetical protein